MQSSFSAKLFSGQQGLDKVDSHYQAGCSQPQNSAKLQAKRSLMLPMRATMQYRRLDTAAAPTRDNTLGRMSRTATSATL